MLCAFEAAAHAKGASELERCRGELMAPVMEGRCRKVLVMDGRPAAVCDGRPVERGQQRAVGSAGAQCALYVGGCASRVRRCTRGAGRPREKSERSFNGQAAKRGCDGAFAHSGARKVGLQAASQAWEGAAFRLGCGPGRTVPAPPSANTLWCQALRSGPRNHARVRTAQVQEPPRSPSHVSVNTTGSDVLHEQPAGRTRWAGAGALASTVRNLSLSQPQASSAKQAAARSAHRW